MFGDNYPDSTGCFHRSDSTRHWSSIGQRCETQDHIANHWCVIKRQGLTYTAIKDLFKILTLDFQLIRRKPHNGQQRIKKQTKRVIYKNIYIYIYVMESYKLNSLLCISIQKNIRKNRNTMKNYPAAVGRSPGFSGYTNPV